MKNEYAENPGDIVKTGKAFVPSLTLSYFSTYLLDFLAGLLLLDVSFSFFGSRDPLHVAITSQIATISSTAAVIAGIAIAVLSVKVNRKLLLSIGALLIPIGSIGCILAPNFLALEIFFPFDGIGSIIVGSLAFALAGEALPLNKRARAIGWIVSGATWAQFVGAILIRYFFASGNWRLFLLWYTLPVSTFAFFFSVFGIPSRSAIFENSEPKTALLSSFKEVFLNKSATACLVGNLTRHAGLVWGTIFGATFLRAFFGLSLANASIALLGGTLCFALGNIFGGHIAHKVGRKLLVVTCLVSVGFLISAQLFIPDVWVVVALSFVSSLAGGMGAAGTLNMTVEQVPKNRGTIMSMSSVFVTLGAAIGAAVGGATLALFGSYRILGLVLVAFDFAAAGIYLFFTKDPCKT